MKRCFLVLLLVLCIFLSACKASDPENLFDIPSGQTESAGSSQITDTVAPESDIAQTAEPNTAPVADTGYYPYGNMQKNVPSGDFVRVGDEVLFFRKGENSGNMLYTYNLKTGEISTFCKDATCSHISGSCAAGGVTANLEIYNDSVYALPFGSGTVLKLQGDRFEKIIDGGVSHFFHSGGKLYVQTSDSSLMVYEKESGQPKMLLEEYSGYWETVFDGKLYYQFDGINCVDLNAETAEPKKLVEHAACVTDGKHIYYAPDKNSHLYRADMDGGNQELLLDKPVLPASWNFDDEYFYFRLYTEAGKVSEFGGAVLDGEDSHDIYRMKKDDPDSIEKIAELPVAAYQIYMVQESDYLFVVCYSATGNSDIYLVSKDGSEEPKLVEGFDFSESE